MNRAITGAWSQGNTKRSTRISLNSAGPSTAPSSSPSSPAPPSSHLNGGSTGDQQIASASSLPVAPVFPPGSAAEAAAKRESEAGSKGGASINGEVEEGEESKSSNLAKKKARIAAGQTSGSLSTNGIKRRRPGGSGDAGPSSIKGQSSSSSASIPTARLKDLGGVSNALDKILELIAMPLCHPEIYSHTGVKAPRGVLLHGPPGCGKTMLASALAGDLNVPLLSVSAPSIVSGTSGESEQTLRQLFEDAVKSAPCILFLDEIDAITPKRETAQREMERRIVAQLLTCLDDLTWEKTKGRPVMVIGATNRPDSLDPALRRAGRFDHEIALGVPDEAGREEILRILCSNLRLSGDFDLRALAKATPGFVGADLVALTAAAGIRSVKRIFAELAEESRKENNTSTDIVMNDGTANGVATGQADTVGGTSQTDAHVDITEQQEKDTDVEGEIQGQGRMHAQPSSSLFDALPPSLRSSSIAIFLQSNQSPLKPEQLSRLHITSFDFEQALPSIQPSSKREGFATVPEVTWADVGALQGTREELEMTIVEPIKQPELFASVGVASSGGVLLWGPPGCGKTLLAKAVANESGANFMSVKGPELLNKYVGESERAVRQLFSRARTSSPCVIFFDELDALVPRRDDTLSESSSRVVNTLLTELDGLEARAQTYVIGATNRPDMIDPAMCRPGRLDKLLYVDLPTPYERYEILATLTKKTPLDPGVDLSAVAYDLKLEGFSGADLAALTREASVMALREALQKRRSTQQPSLANEAVSSKASVTVGQLHFVLAMDKVSPSVGQSQRLKYERLRHRLSGFPGRGASGPSNRGEDRRVEDGEPLREEKGADLSGA